LLVRGDQATGKPIENDARRKKPSPPFRWGGEARSSRAPVARCVFKVLDAIHWFGRLPGLPDLGQKPLSEAPSTLNGPNGQTMFPVQPIDFECFAKHGHKKLGDGLFGHLIVLYWSVGAGDRDGRQVGQSSSVTMITTSSGAPRSQAMSAGMDHWSFHERGRPGGTSAPFSKAGCAQPLVTRAFVSSRGEPCG
jgi:hypothetical protein